MKLKHLIIASCVFAIFTACQEESALDSLSANQPTIVQSRSLTTDNDSIIYPLNPEDFPEKPESYSLGYDSELSDELYSLNEVKMRIRSANAGNKNTLQNYGKGKEIKLAAYNEGNVDQLFYIKVLPASTGIPYLIYTCCDESEHAPIGIGTYSSDPDRYVLYAKSASTTSLYGFSWDFAKSDDGNTLIMENQDIIGSNGDNYWDIFYYSLAAGDGSLYFSQTDKSLSQQFTFIPEGTWEIDSISTTTVGASIISTDDIEIEERTATNESNKDMTWTVTIDKSYNDSIYFKEYKKVTTTKKAKPSLSVKLFKIISVGTGFEFGSEYVTETEYVESSSKTTRIQDQIEFVAEAGLITKLSYTGYRHRMRIPYTLYLRNEDNVSIKIKGMYEGVGYTNNKVILETYPLGTVLNARNTEIQPLSRKEIQLDGRNF